MQYLNFSLKNGDLILASYGKTESMKTTASDFNVSIRWIKRFLQESGRKLNSELGINSQSRIEGQKRFYENFTSSYKTITSREELIQLWVIEDKSIEEMCDYLKRSTAVVYRILKKFDIPLKPEVRKIREEMFPTPARKCAICSKDLPKRFRGATCSRICAGAKRRKDNSGIS